MQFTACPDEFFLVRYLTRRLSNLEREQLVTHLSECTDCREWIILFYRISEELDLLPTDQDEIERITENVLRLIEQDEAESGDKSETRA